MTDDELIVRLAKLYEEKRNAMPLYSQYRDDVNFLTEFDPDRQRNFREKLLYLALETDMHARLFDGMIRTLKRGI